MGTLDENEIPAVSEHPLGAMWGFYQAREQQRARWIATLTLAGCIGILALSLYLRPDVRGLGTHEQLGLAPCGMVLVFGIPCPTCGMTTAFALSVRGEWRQSFHCQPFGFGVSLAVVFVMLLSVYTAMSGRVLHVNWFRLRPFLCVALVAVAFVASWGYKVLTHLAR